MASITPTSNGGTKSAPGACGAGIGPAVGGPRPEPPAPVLPLWLSGQVVNVARHAEALRPFRRDEFGTAASSPTEAHVQAANELIQSLNGGLVKLTRHVARAAVAARRGPTAANIARALRAKDLAHSRVQAIEKIWDFYFELFGQRQSGYAEWLLGCDRVALDCYRYAYLGIGQARSIPAPPPFCYMRTGFSPATFRRGVALTRLSRQKNPFPLVQLPYHRLVNPWTLGAVLHEVSHNLQNDLTLERSVPRAIALKLLRAGVPRAVVMTWVRWNREIFADLSGLLLGGPSVVGSLMDVVGRAPGSALHFDPAGVHPTPYLRTLLSIELLRRMGFVDESRAYAKAWRTMYPNPRRGNFPTAMLTDVPGVVGRVVDAICYTPFAGLGRRCLSQSLRFELKEQVMIEEAARRLAAGNDPGIIPERFLIGAARVAFERRLAKPSVIKNNFYKELARR